MSGENQPISFGDHFSNAQDLLQHTAPQHIDALDADLPRPSPADYAFGFRLAQQLGPPTPELLQFLRRLNITTLRVIRREQSGTLVFRRWEDRLAYTVREYKRIYQKNNRHPE